MTHITPDEYLHAIRLWTFHTIRMEPIPADSILAMGSHDERVAIHGAQLFLKGLAPTLVTSGGYGKITQHAWNTREGERFAKVAEDFGVPRSAIFIERNATNTGDNVVLTRRLLACHGVHPKSGILVTKPYVTRRAYAAATKQWPQVRWSVSAPDISFENYPNDTVPLRLMVSLMVGDLQRLKIYAEQGLQVPQNIPDEIWDSYEYLKNAGFDEFVIQTDPT